LFTWTGNRFDYYLNLSFYSLYFVAVQIECFIHQVEFTSTDFSCGLFTFNWKFLFNVRLMLNFDYYSEDLKFWIFFKFLKTVNSKSIKLKFYIFVVFQRSCHVCNHIGPIWVITSRMSAGSHQFTVQRKLQQFYWNFGDLRWKI